VVKLAKPKYKEILYEKKDWVATLTINRPEKFNAYTLLTLDEMCDALHTASWDDEVGVIVLTGAGKKAFCTGGDVKEYATKYTKKPRDFWKWCEIFERALHLLRHCGKPVIARLNGIVAGGGNEVQMACDLAIAADHVEILQVGTRVGSVAAGGATQWLPIIIGDRRAREMLFTCDRISAEKAKDWGLVNEVVPYDKLDDTIAEWSKKILEKFPECLRFTKAQVNFWKDLVWSLTWPSVRDWLSVHFSSQEPHEGMWAFVEKRPPAYIRLRQEAADGKSPEFKWGPWEKNCPSCGTKYLPSEFTHCGKCGAKLDK